MAAQDLPNFMAHIQPDEGGIYLGTIETGAAGDAFVVYQPGAAEIHLDGNVSLAGLKALVRMIEATALAHA